MSEPLGFAVWDVPADDWKVVLFMVDCPHDDGAMEGADGWPTTCTKCDDDDMIRNPALEWQHQINPIWEWQIVQDERYGVRPDVMQRWVAVGVKET